MTPASEFEKRDVSSCRGDRENGREPGERTSISGAGPCQEHDGACETAKRRVPHPRDGGASPDAQVIPAETISTHIDEINERMPSSPSLQTSMLARAVTDVGHLRRVSSGTDTPTDLLIAAVLIAAVLIAAVLIAAVLIAAVLIAAVLIAVLLSPAAIC